MTKRRTRGPTAERYVDATLALIAESGSSTGINLREISRRIGCAHTNAYNYFSSRDDLMWAAFRKTLRIFATAITKNLDDTLSGRAYFRQLFRNMIDWPLENHGLHRFISCDPLDPEQIPQDIIDTVFAIKRWLFETLRTLCGGRMSGDQVARLGDILLAYMDGEVLNLINGRVLPGEDIAGRVLDNLERMFTLLTATNSDGIVLETAHADPGAMSFPTLELEPRISSEGSS
jgi:AcrR family transcriptional regulator